MYHSISNGIHPLSVSIENFEKQMKFMVNNDYHSIFLSDLNNINDVKKKYFIITFDDGYLDIYENALPILQKYNLKSICFFVSEYIGKYNIWDKDKENFIKLNLMNVDQIKNWNKQGMQVGLHTANHKNLKNIDYNDKLEQIELPKKVFSENLSINIDSFSYPFGQYDDESFKIVKKNYNFAVTTKRSRYKKNRFDLCKLPRVPINKSDGMFKFYLKIKTIYEDIKYNEN